MVAEARVQVPTRSWAVCASAPVTSKQMKKASAANDAMMRVMADLPRGAPSTKGQSEARRLDKSQGAASVHSASMVLWGAASVPNGRELRDHHAGHETCPACLSEYPLLGTKRVQIS